MIRFGTNPIAWANDDDQSLGAQIPTEQILREAAEIGFDGFENGHRWPIEPQALKKLLDAFELAFVSGRHSLNLLTQSVEDEAKAIQPHLEKLKYKGCAVCIVCETSNSIEGQQVALSKSPVLSPQAMRDFGAKVEELAAFAAGQGIHLVYHQHMGTTIWAPWLKRRTRSMPSWPQPDLIRSFCLTPDIAISAQTARIRRRFWTDMPAGLAIFTPRMCARR